MHTNCYSEHYACPVCKERYRQLIAAINAPSTLPPITVGKPKPKPKRWAIVNGRVVFRK